MAYSQKTIDAIMRAPKTSGNQLGRWAAHHNFSVVRISKALGVSRQTVYNWFEGGDIFPAYEHRVDTLLTIPTETQHIQPTTHGERYVSTTTSYLK
jgi:hypothetical protein